MFQTLLSLEYELFFQVTFSKQVLVTYTVHQCHWGYDRTPYVLLCSKYVLLPNPKSAIPLYYTNRLPQMKQKKLARPEKAKIKSIIYKNWIKARPKSSQHQFEPFDRLEEFYWQSYTFEIPQPNTHRGQRCAVGGCNSVTLISRC